jgi:hypothetical protein
MRSAGEQDAPAVPANLRVLPVVDRVRNCGLRGVGLRHSPIESDLWEAFVSVRNDAETPREVTVALSFGGAPAGAKRLLVPAAAERNTTFEFRTHAAGWLEARLLPGDLFPADDRAVLELPAHRVLRVAVYSDSPAWLRPVLAANPNLRASFLGTAQYDPGRADDLTILDRFAPSTLPKGNSIWIEPPGGSPVRTRAVVGDAVLSRWRSDHPLATGLRVQDLRLPAAMVFAPETGDAAVAEVAQGPVILARPGPPKMAFVGFHPASAALRFELATPLIFANIFRWMAPDTFRRWELNAGAAGSVIARLDEEMAASEVSVLAEDGAPLPFTRQGDAVHFFAGSAGTVRVRAGEREIVYSLTLPEVAAVKWEPPAGVRRGIRPAFRAGRASRDLWQMLAVLGALCLLADWQLFGSGRARRPAVVQMRRRTQTAGELWKLPLSLFRRRAW